MEKGERVIPWGQCGRGQGREKGWGCCKGYNSSYSLSLHKQNIPPLQIQTDPYQQLYTTIQSFDLYLK